jgi:hypothetical protein
VEYGFDEIEIFEVGLFRRYNLKFYYCGRGGPWAGCGEGGEKMENTDRR